ncbi:MAG: AAA family ATPase, partial [Desulfobacteraceae bacterium]|nr:AAA family ATPase [Desulfobacteraceae bacterium]
FANSMSKKKYWLYAPGEGAKKWDQFYDEGIMGLGWTELGDLNQYKTKKEISDKLKELDGTGSSKSNDTITNYDFKNTISIGDIIIPKKGRKEYLGYGVAESDYYYDDSRGYYKKCRKVNWKKKGVWEEDGKIVLKTLTDITKYPDYVEKLKKLIGIEDDNSPNKIDLPLNTIIYGPPGTGKTYRLKNEFFQKFTEMIAIQTKVEFCDELIQDTSWWQVISIVMLDLKRAKVQDIFNHPLIQAKASISETKTPKNTIWSLLQRHTKDDCPNVNFKKRDNPQIFEKDTQSTWTIDEEIAKIEIPDFYDILKNYQNFTPQTESKKRYVFTTFHQSFSYEDFIEGIKPKLVKGEGDLESQEVSYHIENGIFKNIVNKALNDPEKDYAIFIDEINRGNIANIFGELITLIEEDKRIECDNYIPAILPYSKIEFGVPENLYIIGTMNTADRSVEALDNALRRRFSFIEMNSEPKKLSQEEFNCEGINLEKLLFAINNRIEKLLDKDYCIGHSYFMNIKNQENPLEELKLIFSDRILPLLQEYFYGDWGKIMLILGKDFIEKKIESVTFLATEDYDDFEDYDEKPVFSLVTSDIWTLETFKKIYE